MYLRATHDSLHNSIFINTNVSGHDKLHGFCCYDTMCKTILPRSCKRKDDFLFITKLNTIFNSQDGSQDGSSKPEVLTGPEVLNGKS